MLSAELSPGRSPISTTHIAAPTHSPISSPTATRPLLNDDKRRQIPVRTLKETQRSRNQPKRMHLHRKRRETIRNDEHCIEPALSIYDRLARLVVKPTAKIGTANISRAVRRSAPHKEQIFNQRLKLQPQLSRIQPGMHGLRARA